MFDFANLEKPIVLYLPDFDEYQENRGMYFDIRENPPGMFASDYEELLEVLSNGKHRSDLSLSRLKKFNEKFCPFDDGRATEHVCGKVFQI
jgi:CDP-glycerol glycerophosphotransferase